MTNLARDARKTHGNKRLPEGLTWNDVENLDITDGKWRHRSIADRFAAVLASVDIEKAVEATGRSARQLNRYANGDEMSVSVVVAMAHLAGVPADWIIGGIPRSDGKAARAFLERVEKGVGDRQTVWIPRYDQRASAGAGTLIVSDNFAEYVTVGRDWLRRNLPPWAPQNAVVGILEGTGDSMEPTIRDGDLIMIVRDPDWLVVERGGIFVLTVDRERLLLKRLQVMMNGDLAVISDNPAYATESIPHADLAERVIVHGQVFFAGGKPRSFGAR